MKKLVTSGVVRFICQPLGAPIFSNATRCALLFAALTIGSGSLWSQISLVHVTSCGPITLPGTNCTIPATGSGNLLVVGWQIGGGANTSTTIISITDNLGNVYAEAGAARAIDTAAGSVADIWYAPNIAAGATSIAVTPSSSVTNAGVVIWELSGANRSAPLDQTAVLNSQAAAATPAGAAVSTTLANEVVISLAPVASSVTGIASGNSFTNDSTLKANGWAHMITPSIGTYFAQWNQSAAATYASCTVSFKSAVSQGPVSACDLNADGVVNAVDAQFATLMSLGLMTCSADVVGPGICNPTVVQDVVTAALGGSCLTSGQHQVLLSWTASTSSNVAGYNVYRGTTSGGPYSTKLDSSLVTGTSYTDNTIQSGQTYYYVATAVDSSGNESVPSNQTQAVIPIP